MKLGKYSKRTYCGFSNPHTCLMQPSYYYIIQFDKLNFEDVKLICLCSGCKNDFFNQVKINGKIIEISEEKFLKMKLLR